MNKRVHEPQEGKPGSYSRGWRNLQDESDHSRGVLGGGELYGVDEKRNKLDKALFKSWKYSAVLIRADNNNKNCT